MIKKLTLLFAMILTFALAAPVAAFAQEGDTVPTSTPAAAMTVPSESVVPASDAPPPVSTIVGLQSLLSWIVLGGAGFLASYIVDQAALFKSLDTGLRMVAVAVLSIAFATVARLCLTLIPQSAFDAIDVYFKDWLPYLLPFLWTLSVTFATKTLRSGVKKARTLTAFSADPLAS